MGQLAPNPTVRLRTFVQREEASILNAITSEGESMETYDNDLIICNVIDAITGNVLWNGRNNAEANDVILRLIRAGKKLSIDYWFSSEVL